MSPKHLALLEKFEDTLATRFKKLKPKDSSEILSLPYMIMCLQLSSETYNDITSFITALELPVSGWDNKWIDVYLDNSIKLLDISIAFSSEISRLSQGQLLLQYSLRNLNDSSSVDMEKALSSLDSWRQHISSKNPRIESCFSLIDKLVELLHLPKVKNSPKGKILMRALYGVKVQTLFVCSVFVAAFTGCSKKLVDLGVPEEHIWASAFMDLQSSVNGEIRHLVANGRNIVVKELEAVDMGAKKLFSMLENGGEAIVSKELQTTVGKVKTNAETLSTGLDGLAKEVDGFFQIVMSGRDALLSNLRVGNDLSKTSPKPSPKSSPKFKSELLAR